VVTADTLDLGITGSGNGIILVDGAGSSLDVTGNVRAGGFGNFFVGIDTFFYRDHDAFTQIDRISFHDYPTSKKRSPCNTPHKIN
jgi:hypothetical protein